MFLPVTRKIAGCFGFLYELGLIESKLDSRDTTTRVRELWLCRSKRDRTFSTKRSRGCRIAGEQNRDPEKSCTMVDVKSYRERSSRSKDTNCGYEERRLPTACIICIQTVVNQKPKLFALATSSRAKLD